MPKSIPTAALVVLIIALAVFVRVPGLNKSFQGDEFFSLQDAVSLRDIPSALVGDTHPPLYFYLLHFWMKISQSEAFLRVLSIIPGIGICLLAYCIGAVTFGERSGLCAALLVALSPVMVWSSQYIRTYSLACFFTVWSLYALIMLLKNRGSGRGVWCLFIMTSSAALYTFYFSALVIIAENVFVAACMRRDRQFLQRWIAAQAAIAVLYLPWIPFFFYQKSSYVAHPQMVGAVGFYLGSIHIGAIIRSVLGLLGFDPRFFAKGAVSASASLKALASAVIVAVSGCGIFFAVRNRTLPQFTPEERMWIRLFVVLALAPFAVALLLHQTAKIILMSHYFIASFIFIALLLVVLAERMLPRKGFIAIVAVIACVYATRLAFWYQDKEMDFIGAHRYVLATYGTATPVVAPSFGGIFDHYFTDITARYHMEDPASMRLSARELVVVSYPAKLELKAVQKRFDQFLRANRYHAQGSEAFGDLIVEKYVRS